MAGGGAASWGSKTGCLGADTLVEFLERRAGPGARALIERHASRCAPCRELLSSLARDRTPELRAAAMRPCDGALAPGASVGRYVIAREIGAGGMGMVYAAHDPELDRLVAVKVLRGDSDPEMQPRLRREAQAMAQLAHPNVVAVHDVGVFDDRMFIAMEHVPGETLARWLVTPRSPHDVLEVYGAAGRGLAAAHAVGIVHRDFKPENVFIGKDARVRVGDFGLARTSGAVELSGGTVVRIERPSLVRELTAPGTLLGTPFYMAPELYGGAEADARSDQFSFCVALYTALYGQRPFAGDTIDALADNVRAGRVREPRVTARVPRRIRAALLRGLSVDRDARFPSLGDLLAELAPRSQRRVRWAIALAAPVAVVAWWIASATAALPDQRCTGAEAAFVATWNPGIRAAIAAAFTATRAPYAATAVAHVSGELDRYAARWKQAHTEACRATRILGEQTDAVLDLRMSCLERRRQEAAALVTALVTADSAAVAHAIDAAVRLPDVTGCADTAALRQLVAPPSDEATRSRIVALTRSLADARARYEVGAFAPALERTRSIVADARALGYHPFEAEAELLQSEIQRELGDPASAEATLVASVLSAEAGRHDEIAARARVALVSVVGYHEAEFARAAALVPYATAAIARIGGNAEIQAYLEQALGDIDLRQRNLDAAIAHFDRAAALAQRTFGPEHLAVAGSLERAGVAMLDQLQPARAIGVLTRVLAIYERSLGPDHPTVARVLHRLGVAHVAARDYAVAEQELRRALAIRQATLGPDHPAIVGNLSNLGAAVRGQGRMEEALSLQRRGLVIGEKVLARDDLLFAALGYEFGVSLGRAGHPAEADAQLRRAEAITAKAYGRDHVYVMFVLAARADVLMLQGRWHDALALYDRALPVFARSQGTAEVLASAAASRSRAYLELHQPMRALPELEQLTRSRDQNPPDVRAAVDFTLARALWTTGGDRGRAIALASHALADLAQIADTRRDDLEEIRRWLADHAARGAEPRPPR